MFVDCKLLIPCYVTLPSIPSIPSVNHDMQKTLQSTVSLKVLCKVCKFFDLDVAQICNYVLSASEC